MTSVFDTVDRRKAHDRRAILQRTSQAEQSDVDKKCEFSALMRRALGGDRIAYERLLQDIVPILKRYLQSRMWFICHADREDVVQDILLSLHAVRATYDPERPFLPWLFSIAHNRTVDHARRQSRRLANEVQVDEFPAEVTDEASNAALEAYGDSEALRQAVKSLPQGQRRAIELLKLREMSLKEAASVSGMSIGALKVSVHRAIKT